ncbi:hypothetical protein V8G54_028685 [Vigna mungo]|uniref:Uncharacterized protein n=1 Tax=Vigna mungo TaxID=3915 RepID=A0AAQ3MRX1_VIGMU
MNTPSRQTRINFICPFEREREKHSYLWLQSGIPLLLFLVKEVFSELRQFGNGRVRQSLRQRRAFDRDESSTAAILRRQRTFNDELSTTASFQQRQTASFRQRSTTTAFDDSDGERDIMRPGENCD